MKIKNPKKYINNINLLDFKLFGGFYDSIRISKGIEALKLTEEMYEGYSPYYQHKKQKKTINTGLWLAKRKFEMKE